jgi:hypothetical protein
MSASFTILCAYVPVAPLAPSTSVSANNIIITWAAPSSNGGSTLTAYSIYIRQANLAFALETTYCNGTTADILAHATCTIPMSTLRASPFSLILNNPVLAQVVATNFYGDSSLSPTGSGAVILYVPDAPLSVLNNPLITSATKIGLTWTAGVSNGGTSILDYTINYSKTDSNYAVLVTGLTLLAYTTNVALVKGDTYYF